MAKQNDPGVPGPVDTSASGSGAPPNLSVDGSNAGGKKTVLEWGRERGEITVRVRRVNFSGPAGGQMERRSAAHASAAQLHHWTDDFQCTREAYEQALKAAMPEKLEPIKPPAPKPGLHRNPAKRRELAAKAREQARGQTVNAARRGHYQPHPAALREVAK